TAGLALEGSRWDIIVSNPPYIASGEIAGLAPEVARYDPPAALDGGADGLAAYRALIPAAARVLRPGGLIALEIVRGQADAVEGWIAASVFVGARRAQDLAGMARCLLATRPDAPAAALR